MSQTTMPPTDPVEAQAKADILNWIYNPKDEKQYRTFAKIHAGGVYPIAVILETYDFILQCLKAKFVITDLYDIKPVEKPKGTIYDNPVAFQEYYAYLHRRRIVQFAIPEDIRHEAIHNFVANFLQLSVSVTTSGGHRAKEALETVKDMGRPQNNPFALLGSMLGNKSPEQIDMEEQEHYPDDSAII